ncbi:MAG: hypothetical protein ACXVP5_09920 [Tumebacillaceae bacterium]
MNVSNVQQSVDIWALKQALAMNSQQALAPVTGQIVNQLASLDSNVGQNLDISI